MIISDEDRRTHAKYVNDTGENISYEEYLALRKFWEALGGHFYGPNVEYGSIPESKLLPVLRRLAAYQLKPTPFKEPPSMGLEEFKQMEPLYAQAAEFAKSEPSISISKMQRKFTIGYNRAARLCERLAVDGILIFNNTTGAWRRAP